jgi:putative PIG3 family NAD(P)H quinone oxidoreductase
MKAVIITSYGAPDVLQVQEVPNPVPQPNEVLIEVFATALNRADLLQRMGRYNPPVGAPVYPGLEVAGRVIAKGKGVTRYQIGDRVMALLAGGGYAEQVAIDEGTVMPIPANLSFQEAAAVPEAWLTAYSNMIEIARLQAGEKVLIHAGASGVGTAAIQLAKWAGATVFTTASAGKLDALKILGADYTIDYRSEKFAERILDITREQGVDVIVDFIGAPYWDENLKVLALWGRLVFVGLMGGGTVTANLGILMAKKLSLHGSTLRDRTPVQKATLVAAFSQKVLPEFSTGRFRPVLDERTFALDQMADAHRYMESNQNVGKIVVSVR